MTLAAEKWPKAAWKNIGTCFFGETADQLGVEGVTGWEGLSDVEGTIGDFPNAFFLLYAAGNGGGTDIGMGGIASAKGLLDGERARCDLLRLAHCLNFVPRLLMAFIAVMAPCMRMQHTPWRATARDCVSTTIARGESGRLAVPLTAIRAATSGGACGANNRLLPLVAGMRPPLERPWRRTTRRGQGAPAARVIRCTRG